MEAFTTHDGLVVPVDRPNVDTDALIPKQFIKSIRRTGFGPHLFDEWRWLDAGVPGQDPATRCPNPAFALNHPRYAGASVLLARENFGCGSSREHAVWALRDYGIRAVIAPSFADIFHGNCFKNGLLPITLEAALVDRFFDDVAVTPGWRVSIDLAARQLRTPDGQVHGFAMDPFRRDCLLGGLDDIGLTLQIADEIRAHEAARRQREPWLFAD